MPTSAGTSTPSTARSGSDAEATGETDDISPVLRGKYDVALPTYEKFAAIALTFPHVLAGAGVVVIDEAQMIADESRGANFNSCSH